MTFAVIVAATLRAEQKKRLQETVPFLRLAE
jgi:hypothetical protein